jgi:hypothetical protein
MVLISPLASGQKYEIEKGSISFFSDAVLEDITAVNTASRCLLSIPSREISFVIPIKRFEFPKKLMQEHFNEKYMESETYPNATFSGVLSELPTEQEGARQVTARGKLTIHGVSREVVISGSLQWSGSRLMMTSKFTVRLEEHKITIPTLMWQNIAEEVEVRVNLTLREVRKS